MMLRRRSPLALDMTLLRKPFYRINHFHTANVATIDGTESEDLYNYTSGRWLYNEELRRAERHLQFNAQHLERVAAQAVGRTEKDVSGIRKLAEGGFNRIFEIVMHDGFQVIARLPYPSTVPKKYATASEVATLDFVRRHNIPTPKVFKYSTTDQNEVGAEYIIMEKLHGQGAGEIWYSMTDTQRIKLLREVVKLEARLFSISFPASGSIYYAKDLDPEMKRIDILGQNLAGFCVGPDVHHKWWSSERAKLEIDRGPYRTSEDVLSAGANRELLWTRQFARSRLPFEPLYREIYDFKKVSPASHIENLLDYLKIAKYLAPPKESFLNRHTLRHPDLRPNNILISESLTINGLIDWQHCSIFPLFLHAKIPHHFQNYGDDESENGVEPKSLGNVQHMDSDEQEAAKEQYRRRHTHYHYVSISKELNNDNIKACTNPEVVLKQKLFQRSSDRWEGDNITLKADLIAAAQRWTKLLKEANLTGIPLQCPLEYGHDEIEKCLEIQKEQEHCDRDMENSRMSIGVDEEGWVEPEMYEAAKERSEVFMEQVLAAAEPGERDTIIRHWPFHDRDENE